jgi:hypothetical protein
MESNSSSMSAYVRHGKERIGKIITIDQSKDREVLVEKRLREIVEQASL